MRIDEAGIDRNVDPGEFESLPAFTGVVFVLVLVVDCSNMAAAALTFDGVPFAIGVDVVGFSGEPVALDLEGEVEVEGPEGEMGRS